MPLKIIRNDITQMDVDAIVNATNTHLRGIGGVDGQIHRAAGATLDAECASIGNCEVGRAVITGAGRLRCKYVIHTVGPHFRGGGFGEREKLVSCYRASLALAKEYGCNSVAFPLISSGTFGYPKDQALRIAVDTISEFLLENDMMVYLLVFGERAYHISKKLFDDITEYIDDNYVERVERTGNRLWRVADLCLPYKDDYDDYLFEDAVTVPAPTPAPTVVHEERVEPREAPVDVPFELLRLMLNDIDESFTEMLLRKIDESGMTDAQVYKKANIDRKLFSKIRSDKNYKPSKPTAIAFAIALELSLEETKSMLEKAGFAFSHSNKFDIIIEYFIKHGNYNIFEINEALFAFDQSLLGA